MRHFGQILRDFAPKCGVVKARFSDQKFFVARLRVAAKILVVKFAPTMVERKLWNKVFNIEAKAVLHERFRVSPAITLLRRELQLTEPLKPKRKIFSNWVSAPHDDLVVLE